jgi:hypothetical protein
MPSKTLKQAKFMRAVAHGFKPTNEKGPSVKVAKEFVAADKGKKFKKDKGRR